MQLVAEGKIVMHVLHVITVKTAAKMVELAAYANKNPFQQ